jgi:hypothetical protein
VAVDEIGNVYIADRQNNRIVIVAPGGAGDVLHTAGMTLLSPEGVAVGVSGTVYVAGYSGITEVQDSAVGFGHLPNGAVSGTTLTLPITIAYNATFGSVQAFTQGTPGLDFTVASTTCVAGVTINGPCTMNITFLPTAAGLRRGAMVIYNNATPNVPILTVPVYGIADAPLAALTPNTGSVINTGGVTLSGPFQVALDGTGNMYVADDEPAPTVLTIQLPALTAGIPASEHPSNRRGLPLAPVSLGFVMFGAVLGRKRIPRLLMLVFMLASLGVTTSLLTGCGGGFASTPSTPPGNYIVTVTGTSGAFQASTTVTLVVQ